MSLLLRRRFNARSSPISWQLQVSILMLMAVLIAPLASAGSGGGDRFGRKVGVFGLVSNSYTGAGIEGVSITFAALSNSYTAVTNANGGFFIRVPANASYDVTFEAENYITEMVEGSLVQGRPINLDTVLEPVARVIVDASVSGTAQPGATISASGSYLIMDGSSLVGTSWSQGEGLAATIANPGAMDTDVTLQGESAYAAHLITVLKEPPITEEDLPPDLKLQPINEIEKGLQNRNQVVGVTPFGLEKAAEVPLTFTVTTSSGSYSAGADVAVGLPWQVSTGIRTVPVNVPVLLYAEGEEGDTFSWSIASAPAGSVATLTDADTQTPWFSPDLTGTYVIQEVNGSGASIDVHVGRYHGVIDPFLTLNSLENGDGRPVADPDCTICHAEGGLAPDAFSSWRLTGHAEAFTQGLNTNGHFGEGCFGCHAVGFDQDNAGGIDDTPNYGAFVANVLGTADPMNWWNMLYSYPDTARMANIQCENCHGPQDYTQAHEGKPGAPRVSLSPTVCGSCHGEPARHGRFQQWQLSNHADYDLARSRGLNGSCAGCHSGNGFVAWSAMDFDPNENVEVTWDADTVQPQVCAACHDPHDTGTTSGSSETDAKVRVMGNTHLLKAGFQATGVGKGATCMTCHNSRRGLRNDAVWDSLSNSDKSGTPHHGVQADLVMGQNAYFFDENELVRGKHSLIEDVCVTCHMNKTAPPAILSYNQSGTNHTFAADPNICAECHDEGVTTENIQAITNAYVDELAGDIADGYKALMNGHYPVELPCGTADAGNPVTEVVWVPGHHAALDVTLQDGSSCTGLDPDDDISVDGGAQSLYELSLTAGDGVLLKAIWNWTLVSEDEGRGVHNPDFSIKALERAIAALAGLEE